MRDWGQGERDWRQGREKNIKETGRERMRYKIHEKERKVGGRKR